MSMFRDFFYEEDGMGTIEIAILIAALVALAIIFRKQLAGLWGSAADAMTKQKGDMDASSEFTTK